jgi:hypothetical protein
VHLSTGVVMMFVAGVLLWLNTRPCVDGYASTIFLDGICRATPFYAQGWPLRFTGRMPDVVQMNLAIDVGSAVMILMATAIICERLIRRREARQ